MKIYLLKQEVTCDESRSYSMILKVILYFTQGYIMSLNVIYVTEGYMCN